MKIFALYIVLHLTPGELFHFLVPLSLQMVQLGEVQMGVKKSGQPARIILSVSYEINLLKQGKPTYVTSISCLTGNISSLFGLC